MKKANKFLIIMTIFFTLLISMNFIYVLAQGSSFETSDGILDFSKPTALAQGLETGSFSVARLFKEGNLDHIESVFSKATKSVQSKILSFYTNSDIVVNGEIENFDEGVISTSVTDLDLDDFDNFDGTITINEDGSVTILPNGEMSLNLDSNQITSANEIRVLGTSNERIVEGSDILIMNNGKEINLIEGKVSIKEGKYVLQEFSSADFSDTKLDTQNTKICLGFECENSYVLFDKIKGMTNLVGNDFSVTFSQTSPYEHVDVDGDDIQILNGELKFTFNNDEINLGINSGRGVKNMILRNVQSDHRIGVDQDGSFRGFSSVGNVRVGFFERRSFWLGHMYNAEAYFDPDIATEYEILTGKVADSNDLEFQKYVLDNAKYIELKQYWQQDFSGNPDDGIDSFENFIKRSYVHYEISSGNIRIGDDMYTTNVKILEPRLESDRIRILEFFGQFGGIKEGQITTYRVENDRGSISVQLPEQEARTLNLETDFVRDIILLDFIVDEHTVDGMEHGNADVSEMAECLLGYNRIDYC